MAEVIHDLAIVGAGCAGLSLASSLAQQAPGMKVILLDPRDTFEDDRTWCFWSRGDTPVESLIARRWPRWRFAGVDGASVLHSGSSHHYACVRGGAFYEASLVAVRKAGFELRLHDRVNDITPGRGPVQIYADKGQVLARRVADTRPLRYPRAKMFQIFAGVEVETETQQFDPDQVGLMEDMSCDKQGFHFIYTLPYSATHALIELTRFAPSSMDTAALHAQLDKILTRRGLGAMRVLRREQGVLPMGQLMEPKPSDPHILRAGSGGGALRAASGYGFLRIQQWAQDCAGSLAQGGPLLAHPPEPFLRAWMDGVFLTALRADPGKGMDHFLQMARALSADGFARFMSDAVRPQDLLRLLVALPPLPFIRAAVRAASQRA